LTVEPETGSAFQAAISPDRKLLAAAAFLGDVEVWQMPGDNLLHRFAHRLSQSVAFSPNGTLLAAGSQEGVRIWDVETGAVVQTVQRKSAPIVRVVFAPDGKTLATGSAGGDVQVWNISDGRRLARFDNHTDQVSDVSFSPDGRTIASSSYDGTVRLWTVDGGEIKQFTHTDGMLAVAFAPDGSTLAAGSADHQVLLWTIQDYELLGMFTDYPEPIGAVTFAPNSDMLATGAID
ncbi:MAG: hypothetical protein CYG59_26615, partial [Chloroflexi bacterium]